MYDYGQPNSHNLGSFLAAVLTGENHESVNDLLLLDVIPLSLGIENSDGEMCVIIKRNSTIPTNQTKSFGTFFGRERAEWGDCFRTVRYGKDHLY